MTLNVSQAAGQRLDTYLASQLNHLSRSQIQTLIKNGHILLNQQTPKAKSPLKEGDLITIQIPEESPTEILPQNIPLEILFEDPDLIIINKAPGMVVHPAAGNPDGTLVNALLYHCQGQLADEADPSRPGIVHRLDKDTSGCLVAAKNNPTLKSLAQQFADRSTTKLYLAVTQSPPKTTHQTVFTNIARHPVHRQRMDVCSPGSGKPAITDLHLLHTAPDGTSLILCALHTGRTHQIRVHQRYLGHPILGDPIYSHLSRQPRPTTRLMLHAWRLTITHPRTHSSILTEAPIPPEFDPWLTPSIHRLEQIQNHPNHPGISTLW